jgi:hypothetical protein
VCSPPHTDTIITNATMRSSRRSEHFASEAVLGLHRLTVDDNVLRPRGRSALVIRRVQFLHVLGLLLRSSGKNTRVAEARLYHIHDDRDE